jgi:hypothetical protein
MPLSGRSGGSSNQKKYFSQRHNEAQRRGEEYPRFIIPKSTFQNSPANESAFWRDPKFLHFPLAIFFSVLYISKYEKDDNLSHISFSFTISTESGKINADFHGRKICNPGYDVSGLP